MVQQRGPSGTLDDGRTRVHPNSVRPLIPSHPRRPQQAGVIRTCPMTMYVGINSARSSRSSELIVRSARRVSLPCAIYPEKRDRDVTVR